MLHARTRRTTTEVGIAITCLAGLACATPGAEDKRPPWPPSQAVTRAVTAGTRWLVALPEDVPPEARLRAHLTHYRVTPDAELAATLEPLIEQEQRTVIALAATEPADMELGPGGAPHLMRLMNQLIVAQANGIILEDARQRGQSAITRGERDIYARLAQANWHLWFGYAVSKLGLSAWTNLRTEIARVRAMPAAPTPAEDTLRLFALTHVVLYETDYGSRYVDAAEFDFEREAFRSTLRFYRAHPPTTEVEIDLLGEILGCYKLMGVPPDDDALAIRALIAARQNPDGSWGDTPGERYHRTLSALWGLIDFAPEPRTRFGAY